MDIRGIDKGFFPAYRYHCHRLHIKIGLFPAVLNIDKVLFYIRFFQHLDIRNIILYTKCIKILQGQQLFPFKARIFITIMKYIVQSPKYLLLQFFWAGFFKIPDKDIGLPCFLKFRSNPLIRMVWQEEDPVPVFPLILLSPGKSLHLFLDFILDYLIKGFQTILFPLRCCPQINFIFCP